MDTRGAAYRSSSLLPGATYGLTGYRAGRHTGRIAAGAVAGWVGGTAPGLTTGVYGWTGVDGGTGVVGRSAFVGTLTNPGFGTGVYGDAASSRGIGVKGASNNGGTGVRGESLGNSIATAGTGVYGLSNAENGVIGESGRSGAIDNGIAGVTGFSTGIDGVGVLGSANSGVNAIGVWGRSLTGYAGYFNGKVRVTGFIEKLGGGFKIDHPLDPANQFLVHSFVESPDMKNIYDGTVTTDAQGAAVVTLPTYFEALNRDVRYQLTVIGQFAQAIVASEAQQNSFTIKTDKPHVRVSWQVNGIRKDPYAEQHRLVPEEPKAARERGKYLTPELYGQPSTAGITYAPEPERRKVRDIPVGPKPVGPTRTNR
jgi:hypothetical protein